MTNTANAKRYKRTNPTHVQQTWTDSLTRAQQGLAYFVNPTTGEHIIRLTGAMSDPLDFWVYKTVELARASWTRRINRWKELGYELTDTVRACNA